MITNTNKNSNNGNRAESKQKISNGAKIGNTSAFSDKENSKLHMGAPLKAVKSAGDRAESIGNDTRSAPKNNQPQSDESAYRASSSQRREAGEPLSVFPKNGAKT